MKREFKITISGSIEENGVCTHGTSIDSEGIPIFSLIGILEMAKESMIAASRERATEIEKNKA